MLIHQCSHGLQSKKASSLIITFLVLLCICTPSLANHENVTCTVLSEDEVECEGTNFYTEPAAEGEHVTGVWAAIDICISIGLILIAGLMSGLTIGLMSLDVMNLRILMHSGTATERKYATKILPVVERHHHLLVTLLLCNAMAMEALPIFLDQVMSPITAILISVTAVLLFGEIIPQALCVRFGLAIGANTAWLVTILMWVTFPITFPIGKLLDVLLGTDHAPLYRRAELKELVTMHASVNQGPLTLDECTIIRGALDMKTKVVKDCMTPLDQVFMLDINTKMDREAIKMIVEDGHSRIPVYSQTKQNVMGLLLSKTLLLVDPAEAKAIRDIGLRPIPDVSKDKGLYEMLNEFQTGKSHMATVSDPSSHQILGIITLEDVIEELIQEEIIDETDDEIDVSDRAVNALKQALTGPPHLRNSGSRLSATPGNLRFVPQPATSSSTSPSSSSTKTGPAKSFKSVPMQAPPEVHSGSGSPTLGLSNVSNQARKNSLNNTQNLFGSNDSFV
mmetsp:Transcript_2569/g.3409  ORF Transcript_2569/g.3409 Transcript_2569/m.3409 type:complete len:507 (+) Transcript_2569:51-1571(+)